MGDDEIFILFIALFFTGFYLYKWFSRVIKSFQTNEYIRKLCYLLPFLSGLIILIVLRTMASYDVIDSPEYIFFYIILAYPFLWLGIFFSLLFFDISWKDDILNSRNIAAFISLSAIYIAITLIYAGSNVGDGPGWWCVIFANLLGFFSFFLLGGFVHLSTKIGEKITIDRNIGSAIRFSAYLITIGVILSVAVSGDWTSFGKTIQEFYIGWPVIPITILFLFFEFSLETYNKGRRRIENYHQIATSIMIGLIFIALAVLYFYYIDTIRGLINV